MSKIDWTKPIRVVGSKNRAQYVGEITEQERTFRYIVFFPTSGEVGRANADGRCGVSANWSVENVPEQYVGYGAIYSLEGGDLQYSLVFTTERGRDGWVRDVANASYYHVLKTFTVREEL